VWSIASDGEDTIQDDEADRKLILFSGNDYMCLSSHPAIREAAVKVCRRLILPILDLALPALNQCNYVPSIMN
jgi:7-keto-8-aminopelargonate synthetase-like enzyme